MSTDSEMIFLGTIEINEAKRIIEKLKERDVTVEANFNKQTCKSGCSTTVELWGKKGDAESIFKYITEEKLKLLEGHDYNPENDQLVFDPSQESTKCPACNTTFSTKEKECPECGLVFVIEDS